MEQRSWTIPENERFKGGMHGLLLGCTLPILIFNIVQRKPLNTAVYTALVGFEVWHIVGHLQEGTDARRVTRTGTE